MTSAEPKETSVTATQSATGAAMDELKFFAGLSAITLIVIGLVIYIGLKLNNTVLKRAPESALPLNITLTGTALWASVVGFWLVCLVAGKLRPATSLELQMGWQLYSLGQSSSQ